MAILPCSDQDRSTTTLCPLIFINEDFEGILSMSSEHFFELRLYQIEPGRMEDMVARWHGPLAKLFQRHGVHPLAAWTSSSGPRYPTFVYLMKWQSWHDREAAWNGFYGDPEWLLARTETNRGSELVERYELNFLREVVPLGPQGDVLFACQELYLPEIVVGSNATARRFMAEQATDPLLQKSGALLGAFEFMTGNDLPRAAMFLGWRDHTARAAALECLAVSPLGRADRYLLQPLHALNANHTIP